MKNPLIARIERQLRGTTDSPWYSELKILDRDHETGEAIARVTIYAQASMRVFASFEFTGNPKDATFISDARSMVDELIDEVERLQRTIERLESMLPEADLPWGSSGYRV